MSIGQPAWFPALSPKYSGRVKRSDDPALISSGPNFFASHFGYASSSGKPLYGRVTKRKNKSRLYPFDLLVQIISASTPMSPVNLNIVCLRRALRSVGQVYVVDAGRLERLV
jgi:hypothetical protein